MFAALGLVGVAITLWVSLSKPGVPGWYFFVPVAYFMLILVAWGWRPMCRTASRVRLARRERITLGLHWSGYQSRVKRFREFFDPNLTSSWHHLVVAIGANDLRARVDPFLNLMARLVPAAEKQAGTLPQMVAEAKGICEDFEILVGAVDHFQLLALIDKLDLGPENAELRRHFLDEYNHFLRDYESFAAHANSALGTPVFRQRFAR